MTRFMTSSCETIDKGKTKEEQAPATCVPKSVADVPSQVDPSAACIGNKALALHYREMNLSEQLRFTCVGDLIAKAIRIPMGRADIEVLV